MSASSFKNGVLVLYDPKANKLWLRNDGDTGWLGGGTPGSTITAQNSKATILFANASVAKTTTDLTLTLSITFSAANRKMMNKAMMRASDDLGFESGWEQMRQYYILDPPTSPAGRLDGSVCVRERRVSACWGTCPAAS